jgi:hypothetical protein
MDRNAFFPLQIGSADAEELLPAQVDGDFDCTKFSPLYQTEFQLAAQADDPHYRETNYRLETR